MKKKVLIINEGFSDNLGDQAIKESLTSFFNDRGYRVFFKHYSAPSLNQLPPYKYTSTVSNNKSKNFFVKLRLRFKNNILLNFLLIIKNYTAILSWFLKNFKQINTYIRLNKFDMVVVGGGQLINTSHRISPNMFSIISYVWARCAKKNNSL